MTNKRTPSKADNFKLITGISRAIEHRLHEAEIATYAKLASLTPQVISGILGEANGVTTKRIVKERWIEQAQNLSSRTGLAESKEETTGGENLPSVESQGLNSFVVELLRDEEGRTKRSKVMHVETGQEDTWPGWQERRLVDFIFAHAGFRPGVADADSPTATPAEQMPEAGMMPEAIPAPMATRDPAPSAESPIEPPQQGIDIVTSTGRSTLREAAPGQVQAKVPSGILVANHPFEVRLALDLSEIDSFHRGTLDYKASIYAKSLKGPLHQSVGEADGKLKPTDTATIVYGNPLPQGLYRLQAIVYLSDPLSKSGRQTPSIVQTGEKLLRVA